MNEGRQMLNEEENQRKEKLKEVVAECFIKGYNKARTIERVLNVTWERNSITGNSTGCWTRYCLHGRPKG